MSRRRGRLALALALGVLQAPVPGAPREMIPLEILKGHSAVIEVPGDVVTAAVGDDDVIGAVVVTPRQILVNGIEAGATSLTLIGAGDAVRHYHVLVKHDLAPLAGFLLGIDPRIRIESDRNGDAVMLLGTVSSRADSDRAVDATVRFLGTSEITVSSGAATAQARTDVEGAQDEAAGGQEGGGGRGTVTTVGIAGEERQFAELVRSGDTRVVNLLVVEAYERPAGERLQALLRPIDARLTVEEVGGVFILHGQVTGPSALTRALVVADRFVGGTGPLDFTVISDRGGVLTGDRTEAASDAPDVITDETRAVGGSGGTGGGSGADLVARGFVSRPSDPKGNIGQNLSRGDVISVANGRVLSFVRVDDQPRVEIRMRIVAIDRNLTDDLGINWRIDGPNVTVGSLVNTVVPILPALTPGDTRIGAGGGSGTGSGSSTVIDTGEADVVGLLTPGEFSISAFIRALEARGAARTLSEPLLTAVSGESANFLVGGEIPIPSTSTDISNNPAVGGQTTTNQTVIVFREFGINLIVRPTVLDSGRISIVLDQVLSEPDFAGNTLVIGGNVVPAFRKRAVRTLTESADGDTWAVAGLLSEEDTRSLQKVPWIADVPIIGALFRARQGRDVRSELVLTVTARRLRDGAYVDLATPPARPAVPELEPPTQGGDAAGAGTGAVAALAQAGAGAGGEANGSAVPAQEAAAAAGEAPGPAAPGGWRRWFRAAPVAPATGYRPFGGP